MMNRALASAALLAALIAQISFSGTAHAESQNVDLCGGTGGNGQIVSIGDNSFVMARNDGKNQNVTLNRNATVHTSAGNAGISALKAGERVTLVGGPNSDGSFSADDVFVCTGVSTASHGTSTAAATQKDNSNYDRVNAIINTITFLFFGLMWLALAAFLKIKKKKSFTYLLFFTIFYIYLYKVLDYTLLQFQSLLLLEQFVPGLMLRGIDAGRNVNLIPLITLTSEDVKTSLLNILMMLPFGFGLPFVTNFRFKKVVLTGFVLSFIIELLQFITGFMANTTFRVADVNDLIFNTAGVVIGFILFVAFIRIFRRALGNSRLLANPVARYIAGRPQVRG